MNCQRYPFLFLFHAAIVSLLLFSFPLKADVVTLYDGKQLKGKISNVNKKRLVITLQKPAKEEETVDLFNVVRYRLQNSSHPRNRKNPLVDGWNVQLSQQGKLLGSIKSWNKQLAEFEVIIANKKRTLSVKSITLEELWRTKGKEKINREGEPKDSDSLYAKNKSNKVQRISGKVIGFKEGGIQFLFQGTQRLIRIEKIVGIVLKKKKPVSSSMKPKISSIVHLSGEHHLPGLIQMDENKKISLQMNHHHQIFFDRNEIIFVEMQNTRLQSLTTMTPQSVEQTPYFNRMKDFQVNKSLNNKSLQIGDKIYRRGFCVHSRTVLNYNLDRQFEKFQCEIGLQYQTGRLGNVVVRVLVDKKILYENKEFTMQEKPVRLNLNVFGKEKLTLIVDYGKNQNVGDRFVWGNPQLIRNALKTP